MHAGDRDAILQTHQFGQHLGAWNDRYVEPVRFDDFGIVQRDRRTGDHNFRAGDVLRGMALEDGGAQAGQALGHRRTLQIRTGNPVAKAQQHLGNPAHADAADAYEMNTLDFGEHLIQLFRPSILTPTLCHPSGLSRKFAE